MPKPRLLGIRNPRGTLSLRVLPSLPGEGGWVEVVVGVVDVLLELAAMVVVDVDSVSSETNQKFIINLAMIILK